jgi:simple sugar transport system permease protein
MSTDLTAKINRLLLRDRKLSQLIFITIAVFALFSLLSPNVFLTSTNFTSMAFQVPEIALLSLAVMLAMLTGGIDLSIVAISNLAALSTAYLIVTRTPEDMATPLSLIIIAMVAGLFVGVVAGFVNSVLIARIGVTPILATLGTLTAFNGLAIALTEGRSITGLPSEFVAIGNGTLGPVPIPFVILIVCAIGVAIYINRTSMGLSSVLIGSNDVAARYSAIGVKKVITTTYMLSGLLSAIAGLLIAARSSSANPDYGSSYVLLAIVIVVLGGVNPYGGFGTVTGVLLASFVLQMVSSGFNALRFERFVYLMAQGLILIGVMVLNTLVDRYRSVRASTKAAARELQETTP